MWLLHDLVDASFDLCRYLLLSDQLKPWELDPLVLIYELHEIRPLTYSDTNLVQSLELPCQRYAFHKG